MSEVKVKSITPSCVLETFFFYVSSLWGFHRDYLPLYMVVHTMDTSQSAAVLPVSIYCKTVNSSYEIIFTYLFNNRFSQND